MRKSTLFILFTTVQLVLFTMLMYRARPVPGRLEEDLRPCSTLVRGLRLTDLCLFTEARYTRNPAMADLHSPFQDHPLALEHFPSGSLVTPPRFLMRAP